MLKFYSPHSQVNEWLGSEVSKFHYEAVNILHKFIVLQPQTTRFHVDKMSSAHVYLRLPRVSLAESCMWEISVDSEWDEMKAVTLYLQVLE